MTLTIFFCRRIKGSKCASDAEPHISIQYIKYGKINEWYKFCNVFLLKNLRPLRMMPKPLAILFFLYIIYD